MRTVKVNFVDFYEGHDKEHNHIMNVLREKYSPVLSENPDYVFCGPYIAPGKKAQEYWKYNGIRIFSTDEAICPDFNLYDYAIGFDDLSFGDRYCRYPIYAARDVEIREAEESRQFTSKDLAEKKSFCSFVVSNGHADGYRERLFEALNEYRPVQSGGRFRNNTGGPVKDKKAFQRESRFVIACENSSYPGYTTEKIIDAYASSAIPIYWGNPCIAEEFDERSFVNCHRYSSLEEVVEAVKKIDRNEDLYLEMMHSPVFREGVPEGIQDRLRAFLFHIFDQPYEAAFRRNRANAGAVYSERQRKMWKLRETLHRSGIHRLAGLVRRRG